MSTPSITDGEEYGGLLSRLQWRLFAELETVLMPPEAMAELEPDAQDASALTDAEADRATRRHIEDMKRFLADAIDGCTPEAMAKRMFRKRDAAVWFIYCMLQIQEDLAFWSPSATGLPPPTYSEDGPLSRRKAELAMLYDLCRVARTL